MAIDKKLLFFKKTETFNSAKENEQILDRSIAFVNGSKPFIYTHQTKFGTYNPTSFLIQTPIDWETFENQTITFDLSNVSPEDFIIINQELCKVLYTGTNLYVINKEGKIAKITSTTFTVLKQNSKVYTLSSITELTATTFTEDIEQIQIGDCINIHLEDKMDSDLTFILYSKYAIDGAISYLGTALKENIIYDVVIFPESKTLNISQRPVMSDYLKKTDVDQELIEDSTNPISSKGIKNTLDNIVTNKVEVVANTEEFKPAGSFLIVNEDLTNDEFPTGNYNTAVSPLRLEYNSDKTEAYISQDNSVFTKVALSCPIAEGTSLEAGDNKSIQISNYQGQIQITGNHTTEEGDLYKYYYLLPSGSSDGSYSTLALRSDIPKVSCISVFDDSITLDNTTLQNYGDYNKTKAEAFFKYAENTSDDRAYTFTVKRNTDIQRVTTKDYFITTTNESSLSSVLYNLVKALAFTFSMPIPSGGVTDTTYKDRKFTLIILKGESTVGSGLIYKYSISPDTSVGSGDSYQNALKLLV